MKVYNNTLVGNAINLLIQDDSRVNHDRKEIELGNTWISENLVFFNNLFSIKSSSGAVHIWARDFTGSKDADDMITASDFNGYIQSKMSQSGSFVKWWRGTQLHKFSRLNQFQSVTGLDFNSIEIKYQPADKFFVDMPLYDFALQPGSVARNVGKILPRDIAEAISVKGMKPPNLGALLLPGGILVTSD